MTTVNTICCVWTSFTRRTIDKAGKLRYERRDLPKICAGELITPGIDIIEGERHGGFLGWNFTDFSKGRPARRYGKPTATFTFKEDMDKFVAWWDRFLCKCLQYGKPWYDGSPLQLGWDGRHRGRFVTIDGIEVEQFGCGQAPLDTPSYGNLVWARVTGLCTDWKRESMALLDLEDIVRTKMGDVFVGIVHAYPRDYGNSGVYREEIKCVFNKKAEEIIRK